MPIFIAAGSQEEATRWVISNRHHPYPRTLNIWRYIKDINSLQGHRDIEIEIVGTFWERRDCGEIIAVAQSLYNATLIDYTDRADPLSSTQLIDIKRQLLDDISEFTN